MVTPEFAGAIATLIGAFIGVLGFLYKIFSFVKSFQRFEEEVKKSISIIKAEVTPNSGKSLKDTVNSLKKACDRIETRQKVLDQRSKAALHYKEFDSCLKMCRKIDIETISVHGRPIHFVGHPYKLGKGIHEGFLIHLYLQENEK
jgi:hypothetical protein